MAKTLENAFSGYFDFAFGERKNQRNGLLSDQELSAIMTSSNPCLVIIKPHATNNIKLVVATETLISDLGLSILIDKKVKFTREQVFGIYGDLCEVMAQGEDGVAFVEGLVGSFVDSNQNGRVLVVHGDGAYEKMKKIKKIMREMGKEDRFRNVLHSSDNLVCAMREITALLPKHDG
ncbi:MAG TPA: nucleoside-diphosphate kinase [Candidatus Woesebacteria bacterium]|nr:nucleoside-diphosphate kinase [Candidatus Woesebacteria bacterium]